VHPELEGFEIEAILPRHQELAVENDRIGIEGSERGQDLGKVARHHPRAPAHQRH
jgi:hypothetical protein